MEFSNENISAFLKGMLELGGCKQVDDTPKMYIRNPVTKEVSTLEMDGVKKQLAIYGTDAEDVIIINPFAEGESETARTNWFYIDRNLTLSTCLIKVMVHIIDVAVRAHNKKEKEKEGDSKAIKFLGKYAKDIDGKMLIEFRTVAKSANEFSTIYYNKTKRTAEFKCALFNESSKKIYPSVRKSTWTILQNIFLKVMDVKDLSELTYVPNSANIPLLESFANMFVFIFDKIKPALALVGIDVDTTQLHDHLEYLELYHQKAKWCASVANVAQPNQVTAVVTPWATTAQSALPVETSALPPEPSAVVPSGPSSALPPEPIWTPVNNFNGYNAGIGYQSSALPTTVSRLPLGV